MKVLKFKKLIDQYAALYPDYDVSIPIAGIGGPRAQICGVGVGFDWYAGNILVETNPALNDRSNKKAYDYLFNQMLERISDIAEVSKDEYWACYRGESKKFRKLGSAKKWLVEKLRTEIKQNK